MESSGRFIYRANTERQAVVQVGSGFSILIPAIVFFFIHRVFDPFEWEPFGIVIVEDARYEED
jgi:hypothetical protein